MSLLVGPNCSDDRTCLQNMSSEWIGVWFFIRAQMGLICAYKQTPLHLTKLTNISEGPAVEPRPHGGWWRAAPFYGRLRNRRADAFGTTYQAICPAVFYGDMAVIWQDAIPIPVHFPSKSGRFWATRRLYIWSRTPKPGAGAVVRRRCGSVFRAAPQKQAPSTGYILGCFCTAVACWAQARPRGSSWDSGKRRAPELFIRG